MLTTATLSDLVTAWVNEKTGELGEADAKRLKTGVSQVERFWQEKDGDEEALWAFVKGER